MSDKRKKKAVSKARRTWKYRTKRQRSISDAGQDFSIKKGSEMLVRLLEDGRHRLPYKIEDADEKNPRYYQIAAVDRVVSHFDAENKIALVKSCTASGKTLMILMLLTRMLPRIIGASQKILVVTHKPDLLNQLRREFGQTSGAPCSYKDPYTGTEIHLATVQELVSERRRNREYFNSMLSRYGLLVLDEVQHYPSGGLAAWSVVVKDFLLSGALAAGFSATTSRFDSQPLLIHQEKCISCGQDILKNVCPECGEHQPTYLDHIVYDYPLEKGVRDRYIVEVNGLVVATELVPREVTWKGGDLNLRFSDAELYKRNVVIRDTLLMCTKVRGRQQVVVFVSRVAEARRLSRVINACHELGVSKVVHGGMSSKEKEAIYRGFRQGKVNVIVNVEVTTEGVDLPNCDVVAIARATRSPELFWQMIGRGTRVATNKDFLLVLDFLDNLELRNAKQLITLNVIAGGRGIQGCTQAFRQDRGGVEFPPKILPTSLHKPIGKSKPAKADIASIDYEYMTLWSKYMPFEEARELVRRAVESGDIIVDKRRPATAWKHYAKSGQKPKDIPDSPNMSYGEWDGWWDWYGVEERKWASQEVDKSNLTPESLSRHTADVRMEWTGPPKRVDEFIQRYEDETGEKVLEQNGFNEQKGKFYSQKRSAEMKVYLGDLSPVARSNIRKKLSKGSWIKQPTLRKVTTFRKKKWPYFIGGEEAWWVFVREGMRLGVNKII